MRIDSTINTKIDQYLKNLQILVTYLEFSIISEFLRNYVVFLFVTNDIYLNKFLLKCNLIDQELFNTLEKDNWSVLELALTTKFELATELEISLFQATLLNLLAQFHYANMSNGLLIYYAHPKDYYIDSMEEKDEKVILKDFPFAFIINPSKFEPEWRRKNYSEEEIMKQCKILVSESDLLNYAPFTPQYLGRGVYGEVIEAIQDNIRSYLIFDNKLQDYILKGINERDWKKYCLFEPISLLRSRMDQVTKSDGLGRFLTTNKNLIEEYIFTKEKKLVIICNTTYQTYSVIKLLYQIFFDSRIKILPIIGKKGLCQFKHVNDDCPSSELFEEHEPFDFMGILRKNISRDEYKSLTESILESTPSNLCPYTVLYKFVSQANIIIINKIFFKSSRLRTNLRKKILLNDPFRFFLIFDNIFDLFNDHIESRCSDKDLQEGLSAVNEIYAEEYIKVASILQNLINLKEGEQLEVDYFLTKFLEIRYERRTKNTNILENVYEICKTPFGIWKRKNGEILQIIDSKSLKNFLRYFYKVYILNHKGKSRVSGELRNV